MKANTYVHVGIRNVGDTDAAPKFHEGTLGESMVWLAQQMGVGFYMKNRIQIAIARNKEGVMIGLDVSRGPAKSRMDDIAELMANILPDDDGEPDEVGADRVTPANATTNPMDDYVP